MRATRQIRKWDRANSEFVDVTIERFLDTLMSCNECRYYDLSSSRCQGVGSHFYLKFIPAPQYVPKPHECEVRLPPSLLSYY